MCSAYSPAKNTANILKHGVSFDDVAAFDWDTAITAVDDRMDYGEMRLISYGLVNGRVHVLVWTSRSGAVRPISFRKANARERKFYEAS